MFCSRKRHVETPNERRKRGESKAAGEGVRRGRRENAVFFSSLPLSLSFFCPSTYSKGYCFYSSLIFLRHKIKDGGYNMNINKRLSHAKNTSALQAKSADALHIQRREKIKELSSRKYRDLCRIVHCDILLFWGQCNKTFTVVIVSEGIVLESENSCYTCKTFIKLTLVYVM